MSRLVFAIPTFRRPELLSVLIESLRPEIAGRAVTVVIADNDCDPAVERLVEGLAREEGHRFVYVPVAERGLSPVRNSLIEAAFEYAPEWQWLIMLDDDGHVAPGWLSAMLESAGRFRPHLLGGPVEGILPPDAGLLARNSIYASRKRSPTGLVDLLNTTQNLLISREIFDLVGKPLFRNAYKASGGEDYDLFRRVRAAGGRIVWCDEAVVFEPAPAGRLDARSVLARYYTTGIYMSKIDGSYDGRSAAWRIAIKGGLGAVLRTVASLASLRKDKFAKNILAVAHFSGRIVGLAGGDTARYVEGT